MDCIVKNNNKMCGVPPLHMGGASVKQRTGRFDESMKHLSGEFQPMHLKVSLSGETVHRE